MKHTIFALILLFISGAATAFAAQEDSTASIAVRIVPTHFTDKGKRTISLTAPSDYFAVVLTNVGRKPIRLWRNWCSYGYYNISFKAHDEDGRVFIIKRKERSWTKNYPDWMIIPPGDHMVLKVTLDPSFWHNSPLPKRMQQRKLKLQAIYESAESKEAKEFGVWCGKVSSPQNTYTIFR